MLQRIVNSRVCELFCRDNSKTITTSTCYLIVHLFPLLQLHMNRFFICFQIVDSFLLVCMYCHFSKLDWLIDWLTSSEQYFCYIHEIGEIKDRIRHFCFDIRREWPLLANFLTRNCCLFHSYQTFSSRAVAGSTPNKLSRQELLLVPLLPNLLITSCCLFHP